MAQQQTVYRTEIRDLTSEEVTSLGNAFKKMKALPADNPHSFKYVASIHGAWYPKSFPNHIPGEFCQHQSHAFAFWHRKYLKEVEIALQANGWKGGLPYWDLSRDTPGVLPSFFNRSPFDSSKFESSLMFGSSNFLKGENQRTQRGTTHNTLTYQGILAGYRAALDRTRVPPPSRFLQASSFLESPHNSVHVYIGGDMGSPLFAAHDPIFFFHHCNVDRVLQLWLANLSSSQRESVLQQSVPEVSPLLPWRSFTLAEARNDGIRYGIAPRPDADEPTSAEAPTELLPPDESETRPVRITIGNVKKSITVRSKVGNEAVAESAIFVNGLAKSCQNCQKRKIARGEMSTIHHISKAVPLDKIKVVVVDDPDCKVVTVKEFHYDKEIKPKHPAHK